MKSGSLNLKVNSENGDPIRKNLNFEDNNQPYIFNKKEGKDSSLLKNTFNIIKNDKKHHHKNFSFFQ